MTTGSNDGDCVKAFLTDQAVYMRIYALSRMIQRSSEAYSSKVKESTGLTTTQVDCLRLVSESGTVTIGAMGKSLGLSPSLATNAADALENRGYISRVRISRDRRAINLEITEKGRDAMIDLPTPLIAMYEKCLSEIDPQILKSMGKGLEILAESLSSALWEG